jgi:hypothetical protein
VEVPVFTPFMEDSHAKAAGEGFGADDGSAGVASLPVTGSSSPASSEVVAVPSAEFGLPAVNIAKIPTATLVPLIIPERPEAVAMVSGSPAVAVTGLEPLGVGDSGELSVQEKGGGSVAAGDGFGSVSAVQRLSQVRYPDFPLPWEDDLSVSPRSRFKVDLPGSEETLDKAACGSSQAKAARNSSPVRSLIRRGFFGPRAAPPPTVPALTSPAPPALPGVMGRLRWAGVLANLLLPLLLSPSLNWGIFGG